MGNHSSSTHGNFKAAYSQKEALRFHHTHSEHIKLFNDDHEAQRVESFCKGICFSARPVVVGEVVMLRVSHISTNWSGFLRVGFTSIDPATRNPLSLPRYACPDMTNLPENWARALPERYGRVNSIISYYVNRSGEVYIRINGEELPGPFFNGVNTNTPLWALIDIYGNATGVQFLDKNYSPSTILSSTQSDSALCRNPSTISRIPPQSPTKCYPTLPFTPLHFHSRTGRAINLNHEKNVATRHVAEYSNAYVFTERPINLSEKIVFQILSLDSAYHGGLTVGMTSCSPSGLRPTELPEDSDLLLDRPEYWVVHKDVIATAEVGDELAFSLSNEGEIVFERNAGHRTVIMHVDKTIPLWLFLDLYGRFNQIKMFGVINDSQSNSQGTSASLARPPLQHRSVSLPETPRDPLTVELPPADAVGERSTRAAPPVPPRLQRTAAAATPSTSSTHLPFTPELHYPRMNSLQETPEAEDNRANECTVCFEKPCDSALYTCGHMCMCYECAQTVKTSSDPLCPICRQEIKDVLRVYKS